MGCVGTPACLRARCRGLMEGDLVAEIRCWWRQYPGRIERDGDGSTTAASVHTIYGPQCILSCAKERRSLPKQGYTCCLAMDGVKILCSGFEKDEKAKIEQLVEAMGGLLQAKVSMDINFVIAKDVSAAKYKWALNILKKPIVSMNWLEQCWIEHRVVPHEPYRILPFTGLTICFTKLDADKRMELKEVILQNGGQYSATLTKKCTHLVATEPGSDKYVVAKKWGHILIVDRRWIDQSVARRACLDENAYLISESSTTFKGIRGSAKEQRNPEISGASFQPVPAASVDDSVSTSQYVQASGDASKICSSDVVGAPSVQETNEMQVDSHVAEDSEAEDDDLYLSNCRISLVGFEEKELSRLVTMIRDGGGSRHVMLSERLTHIILGAPSEEEKKEVRRLAAWGVINVVKVTWLEDCNKAKKEVKVSATHLASDLLLKEFPFLSMDKSSDTRETKAAKSLCGMFHVPAVNDSHDKQQVKDLSSERKLARGRHENMNNTQTTTRSAKSSQQSGELSSERKPARGKHENMNNTRTTTRSAKSSQQSGETSIGKATSSAVNLRSSSSNIFNGRTFCFSKSFSHDRRAEVVDWLRKGGGMLVDDAQTVVDFIIECHGQNNMQCDFSHSTFVSTQWIASCLEVGYMQDVGSHPIFSPLLCRIPFPGFEDFRFCVSQYEEKDRILLKNLCLTLGAKFTDKATNKVTHLICKFASGPKYEAFHKRGVPTITVEWLFECVRQDTIIPFDQFLPKPPTSQDRDTGLCTVSQFPLQYNTTSSKSRPKHKLFLLSLARTHTPPMARFQLVALALAMLFAATSAQAPAATPTPAPVAAPPTMPPPVMAPPTPAPVSPPTPAPATPPPAPAPMAPAPAPKAPAPAPEAPVPAPDMASPPAPSPMAPTPSPSSDVTPPPSAAAGVYPAAAWVATAAVAAAAAFY